MKNISKVSKIAIALILSLTMAFTLPLQVFAQSMPEDNNPIVSFDNISSSTDEIGNILYEVKDDRNEFSKTFMLDDGTTMLAEYDQPIHYKDSNKNWVEYDNTLTTATSDEAEPELSNKSSDIKIKASNKAKDKNMIKLQNDSYKISWGYENTNKSKANIITNNETLTGNDKFTTLKNAVSEIVYYDVYKDVDLQYYISSAGIKENIILKSAEAPSEFNINYSINNLSAKQINNTTIELYNKNGETVYTIEAPYMMDANGNTSTQLNLEIIGQKGSNLTIKLTADYWFIHSIGRAFPITIDPEISEKITSKLTFTEISNNSFLSYGPYYTSSNSYCLMKINSLPKLEESEKIIKATYDIDIINGSNLVTNSNDIIITNLHRANLSVNPYYYSEVIDYDAVTVENYSYLHFDITSLIKQWYNGNITNQGFVIESKETIGNRTLTLNKGTKSTVHPTLKIIYTDFAGNEDNLSYHTVSAGQNAQINIGDYLGNLSITQNIYSSQGARFPVSIDLNYNGFKYNRYTVNHSIPGNGWNLSCSQSILNTNSTLASNGYDYLYTDSNGTNHHLKYIRNTKDSTEKWIDEDGLGLTITKNENNMFLQNGTTTQTYQLPENGGKLLYEKDENNNTITYTYNTDGNISSITDPAGKTTNFAYLTATDGTKHVSEITLPDTKKITLTYSESLLTKVKFADGKSSIYAYNSDGRIISVSQCDESTNPVTNGMSVEFLYNDNGQIIKITEKGNTGTEGNYLNIQYNENYTIFTDRRGNSETHTFDNSGNKISTLNNEGYVVNKDNSGLTVSGGADSFVKNHITESTEHSEIGNNSYYFHVDGNKDGVKSFGGYSVIDTSEPTNENDSVQFLGSSSIKVSNPVSDDNSAFFTGVSHKFDNTSFNCKDITFSAYVKTKEISQIYNDSEIGAILNITCFDSNGNTIEEKNSIGLDGTQDWQRLSVTATVPANTNYFQIYCMVKYASGTAWFDCLQLEEGNCANDLNVLQNANFETTTNWITSHNAIINTDDNLATIEGRANISNIEDETVNETIETTEPYTQLETIVKTVTETEPYGELIKYDQYGNSIENLQGNLIKTVEKTYYSNIDGTLPTEGNQNTNSNNCSIDNDYIYQLVNINRKGIQFKISGLVKATSVPLSNDNRTFGIAMNIYYKNDQTPETHYQEFNPAIKEKQSISLNVIPNDTSKLIDKVAIAFIYGYNENEMNIYNATLNIAAAPLTISNNEESSEIESTDNYISYNVISEDIDKSQSFIQSNTIYDSTGEFIVSETDEFGNAFTYAYDTSGNKISTSDGKGNITNYTYDVSNQISTVSSCGVENKYFYNNSNIAKITHNNFSYLFNYNSYNKLTTTKIADNIITNNIYNDNNGNLLRVEYANGDYVEYVYDEYDNIVQINNKEGIMVKYVYNHKDLIAKAINILENDVTFYYYDFSGNPINKYTQSQNGNLVHTYTYNEKGNSVEKLTIADQIKTITKGTDDNNYDFINNDGIKIDSIKDGFGRITQVKISSDSCHNTFFSDYQYANGTLENSTTNKVSKLSQTYGSTEIVNYEYTYDKNGNITQIKQDGVLSNKYVYDALNQLREEYNYIENYYINYSYDTSGNILNMYQQTLDPTYGYPSGTPYGNNYEYDNIWKDKLSKINSNNIIYDEIGNPISYRDGFKFSWTNGRWLEKVTLGDNTNILYSYNANGVRTSKKVGTAETKYYYDSDKNLVGLTNGNSVLYFYYDANNNPIHMSLNGIMYYYIKNLQGDIVKIIDQDGTIVASYVYDAWGNILNETGDPIIKTINPFRYRGYIYDIETGLYYLQSRYYDPLTGRFLNPDIFFDTKTSVLGTNMFTYCDNNPIMKTDTTGKISSSKSKYDRNKAISYAKKYAYSYNSAYNYYFSGDCANFVSQCVHAGGIDMNEDWYSIKNSYGYFYLISKTWTCVPEQFSYFRYWKYANKTFMVNQPSGYETFKFMVNNYGLKKGDVIYMDFDLNGKLDHAAMISKIDSNYNVYYTAHSNPRFDENLNNVYIENPKCLMKIIMFK